MSGKTIWRSSSCCERISKVNFEETFMKTLTAVFFLTLTFACSTGNQPSALFDSRVEYQPLLDKLEASGGDVSRIIRPRSLADLSPLESGKRYKFAVPPDGTLALAPLSVDTTPNDYSHPILGGGGPVLTAGNLRIEREGDSLARVVIDQESHAYCPTAASLQAAVDALSGLGVGSDQLRIENRPTECVAATGPAVPAMGGEAEGPRYGALMAEVGTRFERMGRADLAGRFELAEFERGELEEIFEEDLPRAEPPRESAGVDLNGVAEAFRETNLPALQKAIASKEAGAFREAFSLASETCNGCHRTSGHAFVEIPDQPGRPVPRLDPVSGGGTSR
jgi:hypothetical protein